VASLPKPIITVAVRELVEFVLRRGDLGGERDFVGSGRALAGIRGHQRLQRARPVGYQKEVRLTRDLAAGALVLRIQGRIDGLMETEEETFIEEIKTVQGRWSGEAHPLHWAQVKLYGAIRAREHPRPRVVLQLTYLELETGKVTEFRQQWTAPDLEAFFAETTAPYLEWVGELQEWRQRRDHSIRGLLFPFAVYRPGQRPLAVAAYRALSRGQRLFLEAPTGIGKTISVLFPAVKTIAEGKFERIFYLTARTVGRTVAEKAFADLRQAGLLLRTLTLTAKDKICFRAGQLCDAAACPFALGYYDRLKPALRAVLASEEITRATLEDLGRRYEVCPFELSLEASHWVDAIICDYNYVFDPRAYLRRHFDDEAGDYAFLVDEAHNLVDRARDMFSADLTTREILETRRALKDHLPRCARALNKVCAALRKLHGPEPPSSDTPPAPDEPPDLFEAGNLRFTALSSKGGEGEAASAVDIRGREARNSALGDSLSEPGMVGLWEAEETGRQKPRSEDSKSASGLPDTLGPILDDALKEAETWLARNEPADFREALLELYFRLRAFRRTAELYDEHYALITQKEAGVSVRLFCLDPSKLLREALDRGKASIFFSATLTPPEYYRELLGGKAGDPELRLSSPFPPANLAVLVQDRIRTQFKARADTLDDVARAIESFTAERSGNYLVYLPSYHYMTSVYERFQSRRPETRALLQRPGMSEAERDDFLRAFSAAQRETLVGFAVMGGIFGEGIDLVGERLIGAIIVGVGLPQLCLERDLIRDYFQTRTGAGFDYAYTFPGMNRVLQAIGRVIRSETDRGAVLLIDTRFAEPRYRRLFPAWWQPVTVGSVEKVRRAAREFWHPEPGGGGPPPGA